MYKMIFCFEMSDNLKAFVIDIELPFVPQVGSEITFGEELDNLKIKSVSYSVEDNDFFIGMVYQDFEVADFKGIKYREL